MDIILEVFKELHFILTDKFLVEYNTNENNTMKVDVNVLISSENDSQVFLTIEKYCRWNADKRNSIAI